MTDGHLKHILTMWLDLEDILLNKRSQSQKDKDCGFHVHEEPRAVSLIETERRMGLVGPRDKDWPVTAQWEMCLCLGG
jgi:hypothetical protein